VSLSAPGRNPGSEATILASIVGLVLASFVALADAGLAPPEADIAVWLL
jgi:hypothetical protein